MNFMYGGSRNISQPMFGETCRTEHLKMPRTSFGTSIGFLSQSQRKATGNSSQEKSSKNQNDSFDDIDQEQLTQKTAEKRPYQRFKAGITFGETT